MERIFGIESAFFQPSPQALETAELMVNRASSSYMRLAPTFHVNADDQIEGFMIGMGAETPRTALPLSEKLFDGISVVECKLSESEILNLMSNIDDTRSRLHEAVVELQRNAFDPETKQDKRASLDCMSLDHNIEQDPILCDVSVYKGKVDRRMSPFHYTTELHRRTNASKDPMRAGIDDALSDFVDYATASSHLQTKSADYHTTNVKDANSWRPQVSSGGFVGLYHQWFSGVDSADSAGSVQKQLKMFLVCSSYASKACLEFYNRTLECPPGTTAGTICESKEAW